ncbi:MAG: molybdopterin-dependent oxidoreductase [Rhodobacteraceae bacterium]|nr:molybdopterin-dependent oxidoreductase [Paracoccaceae bacterium]
MAPAAPAAPAVDFALNGRAVQVRPALGERLSETLRERLGAREVKLGCNAGDCGACSVLVAGQTVCACLVPTHQVEGQSVETLPGLMQADPHAKALAERFQDQGAAQCGICTPGMIVSAVALLRTEPSPDEAAVKTALGGVLCRCTGYRKIIDAVLGAPAVRSCAGAVGDGIRRLDGRDKIMGLEAFGDDIAPPGTLEIRVLRAPYPCTGFAFGDLQAWCRATEGIKACLTAADIAGENRFGVIAGFEDQPVFAESVARFRGEAIAAIVGLPQVIRRMRPSDVPVQFTELPSVQTLAQAQAPKAVQLHSHRKGNRMCKGFVCCGEAEAALRSAHVVVRGHFSSGFVEHAYIEPEAGFAQMVEGRLEIHACTQAPAMDRESLAAILGLDRARIRILPTGVGGGFGSKLDLSVQPYLALAALKTEQPVRLTYSRAESMQSTTKRHPSEIDLTIGARSDGRLCGFDFKGNFNTGAYASWGPTVATRVPIHASGPYAIADYRAEAVGIYTHAPPAGAFRGFGVPQAALAQESLFDDLAERLGMDRLEFRIKNALQDKMPTVCGQVFDSGVGIRACLEALIPHWQRENAQIAAFHTDQARGPLRRGVGVASGWYGCGNTSMSNPSTIKAGITAEGTVVLHQGAVDIGQGSNTVIAQIFATALGVGVHQITQRGADTDITPDAGKTSASRQTFISGNAARLCGAALRTSVLRQVNAPKDAVLELARGQILVSDPAGTHRIQTGTLAADAEGYVFAAEETYDPPSRTLDENGQGQPYAQFGYAAQLAVVEVDLELGTVQVLRFVAAHDVGKAINPLLVEGQVQGGIAQGLGMALMETYLPGRTENLHDYLIPTIGDMPPVETLIIEVPDAHGPYGAKGLGEHALIPSAPAIVNAIKAATGVRITRVPVTPSDLLLALKAHAHDPQGTRP